MKVLSAMDEGQDAVTKDYVDTKLAKSGGAITGAITRDLGSGTIADTNLFAVTGSTDGFKINYNSTTADTGVTTITTTDDANAKISIGNTVSGTHKEAISIVNGSATVTGSVSGNAGTSTKLATARTIGIGTGATGTATSFDGSSNITIPITDVKDAYVTWGGKALTNVTPDDAGCIDEFGHNKLAFLPASCITVEYTTNGGTTWLDYGLTDTQKIALVTTGGPAMLIGKGTAKATDGTLTNANCGNYKVRVMISTRDSGGTGRIYTSARKVLINMSTSGAGGCKCLVENRTIGNYNTDTDTWTTVGTYDVAGWSGWNSIPYNFAFGGGTTQTGQIAQVRFTLSISSVNTSYDCTAQFIDFRLIGMTNWGYPSEMARAGHLYTMDTSQNATFPANLKGATVTSTGVLTAGSITTAGNITASSGDILLTKNGTTGGQQVKWSVGANDYARVYGGATASNAGYLEIATGDDSNEPIYARQYSGNFTNLTRTATLLDASGDTSFPGTLTANKIDATKLDGTIPTTCYTNTKNTAGSTDSSSKLFIVGATEQSANPQTYSQDTAYVGTDGHLYSNSKQVVNLSDSQALTNKTYNGYTLAGACAKSVVTTVDTSASLPTSNAVKTFVEGKGYTTIVAAAYCNTASGTAAKTASCTNYTLTANTYLHIIIVNANSYNGAITLNVNGKGAKAIYINDMPSSSSNKTLPAGTYICYYDGTNYYFNTDGKLPGTSEGAYHGVDTTLNQGTTSSNIPTSAAVVDYINGMGYGANNVYVGTTTPSSPDVNMWVDPSGMLVAKNDMYVSGAIWLDGMKLFWYE